MAEKDHLQTIEAADQHATAAPNKSAQHAAADEKSMSLLQSIRLYPKAVGWSVVLSSALIMEGYDLALLGSLYGSPQFNRWSLPGFQVINGDGLLTGSESTAS